MPLLDTDNISSNESEGAFNEFIEDQLENLVDSILTEGDLTSVGDRGSEVIVEIDDIVAPTFTYGDESEGGGAAGAGPGRDGGKIRFNVPFEFLMERIARSLRLPNLRKQGRGKIKEVTHEFKTFAPVGTVLDKKRTFKRALKTSIGMRVYRPEEGRHEVHIHRRDRRYKVPERVEKPKFKAVVFYMGDISFSTYGERLKLEKRLVGFIQHWIDFNYGAKNVEHRFFVHDADAHEVQEEDFYRVGNAGGTLAAPVYHLVQQVATNEYDPNTTNFYAFYFGDGELFDEDAKEIVELLEGQMRPIFNRIGIVEVQPGRLSLLNRQVATQFHRDSIIRLGELNDRLEAIEVIKTLFSER
jgi:uncharacterized sporulation protein YeaH/YhbH (DUF444 family)